MVLDCELDTTAAGRRSAGASPASFNCARSKPGEHPLVVLDTNCVLDAWLFADPRVADVAGSICAGGAHWIATPAMRSELARVLHYPAIVRQLQARDAAAADVLAAFDRWARAVAPARACALRCADPDDQMFVDLAVHWHAALFSRDHAVRLLAGRLRLAGVGIWPRGTGTALELPPA